MIQQPTHLLPTLRLGVVLLAASLLSVSPAGAAPASESHVVVLRDGTTIASRTRPVMGMGQVSFVDASGFRRTLRAADVDIQATRNRLPARQLPQVWDARTLATSNGRVQLTAEGADTEEEADDSPIERDEQVALLRERVAKLEEEFRGMPDTEPRKRVVRSQLLALQGELRRLNTTVSQPTTQDADSATDEG